MRLPWWLNPWGHYRSARRLYQTTVLRLADLQRDLTHLRTRWEAAERQLTEERAGRKIERARVTHHKAMLMHVQVLAKESTDAFPRLGDELQHRLRLAKIADQISEHFATPLDKIPGVQP